MTTTHNVRISVTTAPFYRGMGETSTSRIHSVDVSSHPVNSGASRSDGLSVKIVNVKNSELSD